MIDNSLVVKNAPPTIGEQIHINHDGCSMGVDKKRRLYIKRTPTGLLAYCHHCSEHSFVRDNSSRLSTWIATNNTAKKSKTNKLPELGDLSLQAKIWLTSYGCDSTDHNFCGVSKQAHLVSLCINNVHNELIGYQIRNLEPNAKPKYITYYFEEQDKGEGSWFYKENSDTLVITEDYLSAYRVSKDTKHSSLALLRTTITDKLLQQIHELNFTNIYIWLDPDAAGTKGARKAYEKLTYFLNELINIKVIKADKEPKECFKEELNKNL